MKSFNSSWFLMFLGLFVCKLACVHEFIEYDGFNAFNAKIIRLPHAEIKQARHSNKRSSDFITKLVIVYNETHYGHVICLDEYQSLCDEKHYKNAFRQPENLFFPIEKSYFTAPFMLLICRLYVFSSIIAAF